MRHIAGGGTIHSHASYLGKARPSTHHLLPDPHIQSITKSYPFHSEKSSCPSHFPHSHCDYFGPGTITSIYRLPIHVRATLLSTSCTKSEWSFLLKANNLAKSGILFRTLQCLPCMVYKALLGMALDILSSPVLCHFTLNSVLQGHTILVILPRCHPLGLCIFFSICS